MGFSAKHEYEKFPLGKKSENHNVIITRVLPNIQIPFKKSNTSILIKNKFAYSLFSFSTKVWLIDCFLSLH